MTAAGCRIGCDEDGQAVSLDYDDAQCWTVPSTEPIDMPDKLSWTGKIIGVQPRIRLMRSFDEVSHSYLGYVLRIDGTVGDERREFSVGVGKGAQARHGFEVGDLVEGKCMPVEDARKEPGEFDKTSAIRVLKSSSVSRQSPPWLGCPPPLETYRARRHRRLDARTYSARCGACIWGCRMPVEIVIDHWNPSEVRYRRETFCYGPKSCPFYRAGPTRKVPGRNGMVHEEEDWVDQEATAHRSLDE